MCTHAWVHNHTHTSSHIHMCAHTEAHTQVGSHTCAHTCTCVCEYTHTHAQHLASGRHPGTRGLVSGKGCRWKGRVCSGNLQILGLPVLPAFRKLTSFSSLPGEQKGKTRSSIDRSLELPYPRGAFENINSLNILKACWRFTVPCFQGKIRFHCL